MALSVSEAADCFAAIGSEPRLKVLAALVRAGPDGLSVSEIQARLDVPGSTLTHHLKGLVAAGLVVQSREGRTIRTRADYARIETLADFLLKECCIDARSEGALND